MRFADKRCRKGRRGGIPFSKKQKHLMGATIVLHVILIQIERIGQRNRPNFRRLKRLAKKYEYKGKLDENDIEEVLARIKVADHEYNTFRPKAHELRETYLSNLAAEFAELGKLSQD